MKHHQRCNVGCKHHAGDLCDTPGCCRVHIGITLDDSTQPHTITAWCGQCSPLRHIYGMALP